MSEPQSEIPKDKSNSTTITRRTTEAAKMQRESSLDTNSFTQLDEVDDAEIRGYVPDGEEDDEGLEDLPPGRMHATRSTSELRLKGSSTLRHLHSVGHASLPNFSHTSVTSTTTDSSVSSTGSLGSAGGGGGGGVHDPHRRTTTTANTHLGAQSSSQATTGVSSSSSPSSSFQPLTFASPRCKSPQLQLRTPGGGGSTTATAAATTDGNSSISSLEDLVDSDILYDRAGFQDLEVLSAGSSLDGGTTSTSVKSLSSGQARSKSRECINLPSVNERLSDETMEDVHAFSDVKVPASSSSNASRANSLTDAGDEKAVLDPLEEGDEEDDSLDQDQSESSLQNHLRPPAVILTNLENLSLQAQQNVVAEEAADGAEESQTQPTI